MSYERRRPGTASSSRRPYYVVPSSRTRRRTSDDFYDDDDYDGLEEPAPRKRHSKAPYVIHRPAYPAANYFAGPLQVPQSPTEGYYESVDEPRKRHSTEFFGPDERRPIRTAAPPRLNVSYSESMARQSRPRPFAQERTSRSRRHVAKPPEIQPLPMEVPMPETETYTEQIIIPEKQVQTRTYENETENEERDGSPHPYQRSESNASWRDPLLRERRQGENDDFVIVRPASPTRDVDVFEQFNFVCNEAESSKNGNLSDLESPTPDKQSLVDDTEMSWATAVTKVHASQYRGDAEIGGHHNATFTVKHGLKGRNQPLFRWLHIQQDVMNFDDFWLEISRELHLNEMERSAVARLRASVKQRCVGSTYNPNGQKVGYIEPKLVEVSLEKPKYLPNDKQDANAPMVKWICIPYFALHGYSGLSAGSSTATFPSQTLLQMQYSRIPQQRDMDQAICQLGIAEKDECFHISQLWCVVIDNSILVTCGELAKSELQGEAITFASELSPPTGSVTQRILVKYGEALTWTFSVSECRTWFAFISHFTAFWPSHLEFLHNGKNISPEEWPKLLRYVSKVNTTTLELRVATYPETLPRSNLKTAITTDADATIPEPSSSKAEKSKSPNLSATMIQKELDKENVLSMTSEPLHVLPLANPAMGTKSSPDVVVQDFDAQLKSAEEFITKEATYTTQLCYTACITSTRDELIAKLAIQNVEIEDLKDDEEKRRYEERLEVANALDAIFQLFLPMNCKGPTSGKYWGAIVDMLGVSRSDGSYDVYQFYVTQLKALLRSTWADTQVFQNFMSHAGPEDRAKIEFPREFSGAWLHLLSGLVTCRANIPRWEDNFERAKKLLATGMSKIIQGISSDNLLDHASVQPLEVVSLVALQLLQDQVGKSGDISETYSLFLNSLDTDITSKPIDRSNQHKLDLVKPEMRAVIRTLYKQRSVMASLRKSLFSADGFESFGRGDEDMAFRRKRKPAYDRAYYADNPYSKDARGRKYDYSGFEDQNAEGLESASKLSPTNKYGFRNLFLTDCVRLIEQRDQEFRRFEEYVEELESAVAYKVESTKDRQENAVYAFTAISYIFLPLSAIAGIFGMNTSDVRDMEYRQWLYWAIAIPVTILVIIGGLWWMNELGNVWRWLTGRGRQMPLSAAVAPAPETYYVNRPLSPEYEVVRPAPLTRLQQYVREPRNRAQLSRRRTHRQSSFSVSD